MASTQSHCVLKTPNADCVEAFKLEKIVVIYTLRSVNGSRGFHALRRARQFHIVFTYDLVEIAD